MRRPWTSRDVAALRRYWPLGDVPALRRALPDRTPLTLDRVARREGLRYGVPPGSWSIEEAARASGYGRDDLLHVLEWAGVSLKLAPPRAAGTRAVRSVRASAVRDAIERWHAAEYVEPAARARGIGPDVLRRRLVAAGYARPIGHYWRVATTIIDAVLTRHPVATRTRTGQRRAA